MKKILFALTFILMSFSLAIAQTPEEDVQIGIALMKQEKFDSAFSHFLAAAQHKNYEGMYFAGNMYTHGVGTPVDKRRAYFWLRYAADSGNYPRAYEALGTLYYQDKKMDSAKIFLEKALEYTESAASPLAVIYYDEGETKKALRLFRDAADAGDAVAMYYLGQMLYDGEETDPNEKEAVRWMQRAAKQNYKPAKEYLEDLGYDDLEDLDEMDNPKSKKKASKEKKKKSKSIEDDDELLDSEEGKKVKLNKKEEEEKKTKPKRKSKKEQEESGEEGEE